MSSAKLYNLKAVYSLLNKRIDHAIGEIIDELIKDDKITLEAHIRAHYNQVSRRQGGIMRSCEVVLTMCSAEFGVPVDKILSEARPADVALARQVSMALCYQLIEGIDLTSVAKAHGRVAHGTVTHALTTVQNRVDTDRSFSAVFYRLRDNVEAALGVKAGDDEGGAE